MNSTLIRSFAAASLVLALGTLATTNASAQTADTGLTRAQVKMDRDAFLAMARWDEIAGNWVLREGMAMPAGVASRSEIMAMRDKFLSMHTWSETESGWMPVTGQPRDMSQLSREQVRIETVNFLKMYRFDESTSQWVSKRR